MTNLYFKNVYHIYTSMMYICIYACIDRNVHVDADIYIIHFTPLKVPRYHNPQDRLPINIMSTQQPISSIHHSQTPPACQWWCTRSGSATGKIWESPFLKGKRDEGFQRHPEFPQSQSLQHLYASFKRHALCCLFFEVAGLENAFGAQTCQ